MGVAGRHSGRDRSRPGKNAVTVLEDVITYLRDAASVQPRGSSSLLGRATLMLAGFPDEVQMELEFLFQVAVRGVASECAPQTTQQFTKCSQGRL